jgi:hypothetical protein
LGLGQPGCWRAGLPGVRAMPARATPIASVTVVAVMEAAPVKTKTGLSPRYTSPRIPSGISSPASAIQDAQSAGAPRTGSFTMR